MNPLLVFLALLALGVIVGLVGAILFLIDAFRQSIAWGLVVLFVPLGNVLFLCLHWAESRRSFFVNLAGMAMIVGAFFVMPDNGRQVAKNFQFRTDIPAGEDTPTTHLERDSPRLTELRATYARESADLAKEYETLAVQRAALPPDDQAAITRFNTVAAAYQTRITAHQQMQQEIEKLEKELATSQPNYLREIISGLWHWKKVVLYTKPNCPACDAAKVYFARKGVDYEEIEVDASPTNYEKFKKAGGKDVPLIIVDGHKVDTFSPQALDALL